jgi:hypothetical protein
MKLRILTPTRGDSPHAAEAFASIARFAPEAEHVVISPRPDPGNLPVHPGGRHWVADAGQGIYAALNRGLAVPGDWEAFTWINDDDRLEEGFGIAVRELAAASGAGIGYGRVSLIDAAGASFGALPIGTSAGDLTALLRRGIMPIAQPGTLIRRSVGERIGALDETYRIAGDLDFLVRALAAGVVFAHCRATVASFRLRPGQLSQAEALNEAEFARAVRRLGPSDGGLGALLRFRWANRRVYWDRWRRHGGLTMREVYRRA